MILLDYILALDKVGVMSSRHHAICKVEIEERDTHENTRNNLTSKREVTFHGEDT